MEPVTYKGTEISLTNDFKFEVVVGGEYQKFASLSAAKKAVDKHASKVFVPFEVLVMDNNWGSKKRTFKKVQIVSARVEKGRGRWNNDKVYFEDNSGDNHRDVNTCYVPSDKAALETKYAEVDSLNKQIELLRKKRDDLETEIDEKYGSTYQLMAEAAGNNSF